MEGSYSSEKGEQIVSWKGGGFQEDVQQVGGQGMEDKKKIKGMGFCKLGAG